MPATPWEIEAIEQLAGQSLPRCYRWYLMTMGRCQGAFRNYLWDFTAPTIVRMHGEGEYYRPNPRSLVIGHSPDGMMPVALRYDLMSQANGDAPVVKGAVKTENVYFDSLRELIGYGVVITHGIDTRAQTWAGAFTLPADQVLGQLEPAMAELGFEAPIPTGQRCRIYRREDMLLAAYRNARWLVHVHANTPERGRDLLATLARMTSLGFEPLR